MAREYARVRLSIWADTDFRKLSDPAQSLYFRILTSPTMKLCGIADWRPARLAALTAGMTADRIREVAAELEASLYIITDDETEEVLVRSFIRHDGLIKTPNIAAAMAKDYGGAGSELLRGIIIHELLRLHAEEPDMKGWSACRHLLEEPSIDPSSMPSGMASGNPSGMPSVTALPIPSGNGSDIPQPASLNQQPASPVLPTGDDEPEAKKRKTQLPDSWEPSESNTNYAKEHGIDVNHEAEQFRNHHLAKGSLMLDWNRAFRTWLGNAATNFGRKPAEPASEAKQPKLGWGPRMPGTEDEFDFEPYTPPLPGEEPA